MNAPSRFDWTGKPVVIVASGKSALRANIRDTRERLPDAKWVAVNLSYRLVPWCDVLYGGDSQFWHTYNPPIEPHTRPICAQGTRFTHVESWNVRSAPEWSNQWGWVGNLGNSGAHALNIAMLAGARDIALVGFDMCGEHWHPDHNGILNPTDRNLTKWAERFTPVEGVRIVNCSPVSRIKCYPVQSLTEWTDGISSRQVPRRLEGLHAPDA